MQLLVGALKQAQQKQKTENQDKINQDIEPVYKAISRIFIQNNDEEKQDLIPQVRANLLTILLCGTLYCIYLLFQSNIDTIILAFISAVAYVHLRNQFTNFFLQPKQQGKGNKKGFISYFKVIIYLIIIICLPQFRQLFLDHTLYPSWSQFINNKIQNLNAKAIMQAFLSTNNVIRLVQIFSKIVVTLFGNILYNFYFWIKRTIQSIIQKKKGKNQGKESIQKLLHGLFLFVFIIAIVFVILFTASITFQVSQFVKATGSAVENFKNCSLFGQNTTLQACGSLMTNTFSKTLPHAANKKIIQKCIHKIQDFQNSYLKFSLIQDKRQACLVYQMLKQYSPKVIEQIFSYQYISQVLNFIKSLLVMISNGFFTFTTFFSVFLISIQSYKQQSTHLNIFGQSQSQLFRQSTSLVYDYFMVAIKHLVLSLVLFEIFAFSSVNMILALSVSAVTLFPLISVNGIMFIITLIKYYISDEQDKMALVSSVATFVLFKIGSGQIFNNHFNSIDFSKALISLSAVFGLYRFGLGGTFYGPLLILLFRYTYSALLRKKNN